MDQKYLKKIIVLSFFILFFTLTGLGAEGVGSATSTDITIDNPLEGKNTITDIIYAIVGFLYKLSFVVAPLIIVIAGYFFVFSGGDINKVIQGRQMIIYTLIGLLIIMTASGIIALLKKIIGAS